VWATNGISRKLLPGMQFPEGKLFPSDWHRGDAPSIRCDRRCGRGVRLTVEKSRYHSLTPDHEDQCCTPPDIENRQAYSFRHVANLPEGSAGTHGAVGHEEILFLSCVPDRLVMLFLGSKGWVK